MPGSLQTLFPVAAPLSALASPFRAAPDKDKRSCKALAKAQKPTFLYWLTVNAHLRVSPGENPGDENCAHLSPRLARHMPPYFDRTMRTQFDSRHVQWIRLTPLLRGNGRAQANADKAGTKPA